MKYLSTRQNSPHVSFSEAIFKGLAPDGGLYLPETIPQLSAETIANMATQSLSEIALQIAYPFLKEEIDEKTLKNILEEQINFDAPLYKLNDNTFILELFHGPTLAFKDFGARFLAGIMSHSAQTKKHRITILTATSGDTGSAVAKSFYDLPNIDVIILYPQNKVSELQRKQMTTLGKNITCIELEGNFDDCQKIVKESFTNQKLCQQLNLTSANSINIGRLIPQMFYYYYSFSRLQKSYGNEIIFSVPSGNFGNLTAGLMAKKMGLTEIKLIASTNVNDVIPQYLATGKYQTKPSVETISSAMDIGNPSNFERIKFLFENNFSEIQKNIFAVSSTDEETKTEIQKINSLYNYLLDPHGAVAFLGLEKYKTAHQTNLPAVIFATAHPAKFSNVMEKILQKNIFLPKNLASLKNRKEKKIILNSENCASYLAKLNV